MLESKGKKEKTVILQTRDIVLLFVFFIVVLMVVFTIGLLVGRTFSGRETELTADQPEPGVTGPSSGPAGSEGAPTIQEITLPPSGDGTEPAGVPPRSEISSGATPVVTPPATRPAEPATAPPAAAPKPAPATPPAVTPVVTPPSAAALKGTVYMVQAMATGDISAANKMVDLLRAKGYSAAIQNPSPSAGDQFYRVYAGKFQDQQQARALIAKLRKDGFDVFLKKIEE